MDMACVIAAFQSGFSLFQSIFCIGVQINMGLAHNKSGHLAVNSLLIGFQ